MKQQITKKQVNMKEEYKYFIYAINGKRDIYDMNPVSIELIASSEEEAIEKAKKLVKRQEYRVTKINFLFDVK